MSSRGSLPVALLGFVTVGLSATYVACGADAESASSGEGRELDGGTATTLPDGAAPPPEVSDGGPREDAAGGDDDADASASEQARCADAGAFTLGAVTNVRGGNTPTFTRTSYDYAPAVMHDGAVYRMWWCGGVAGDHILYAEAGNLDGPWHARGSAVAGSVDDVFQPTGTAGTFDKVHTCDPSVIRVGATWYLYYGGHTDVASDPTKIGVATSVDGVVWTRANGGQPILSPFGSIADKPNKYGAGQPSVLHKGGKFYVMYTDTTAPGSDSTSGAGQYVVRSSDPLFQTGVEELTSSGFAPGNTRARSVFGGFSLDFSYSADADRFVYVVDGEIDKIQFWFSPTDFASKELVKLDGSWREGAGLVRRPDGQLEASATCASLRLDVMRPVGGDSPNTWDLAHAGCDVAVR